MARSRSKTRRAPHSYPAGTLIVHAEGYGFVRTAEGEYFIPAAKLGGAFDGDTVEISPLPAASSKSYRKTTGGASRSGGRPAARVVRVIERAHELLVGRYEVADPFGVVVPEDPRIPYDIFTQRSASPDVPDGALVRVRITTYPSHNTAATGVVEEVLGEAGKPRVGIESIIARHKIETRFSRACSEDAERLTLEVDKAVSKGYADLRQRCVCTIDPTDARDFDDALSLDYVGEGETALEMAASRGSEALLALQGKGWEGAASPVWRLGVHIADVSAYVPWGGSVDIDARNRATSVYLADRVVPMLPEKLSCDLCSLRPNEPRLSLTVDLFLDDCARVASYRVYPAVICSDARLTYDQAQAALEGSAEEKGVPAPIAQRLAGLSRIARLRDTIRRNAGALDFPSVEAKVSLDAQGSPVEVVLRKKTLATSLVEQAMILANEAVARYLVSAECPGLFRVHERPAADALAGLIPLFEEFSWFERVDTTKFAAGDPFALQECLEASKGRSEAELVGSLLLRSMKRADYRPMCDGHYGLALSAYAHFTSPIRRYPDLVVHRMLKACLYGRPELYDQEVSALRWLGRHCSEKEREADEAARESRELKLIELLEQHVGEAFSGVVSGVAAYGLYVRLDSTAEGLLPVRKLGCEYYSFDADLHRLVGQDSGRVWRLGQRVAVVLSAADARRRILEFRLAGDTVR